jgi:hypothetical protein
VTAENLAVFTVRYQYAHFLFGINLLIFARCSTPWKRVTSYDVPADMPACPSGGCICAVRLSLFYSQRVLNFLVVGLGTTVLPLTLLFRVSLCSHSSPRFPTGTSYARVAVLSLTSVLQMRPAQHVPCALPVQGNGFHFHESDRHRQAARLVREQPWRMHVGAFLALTIISLPDMSTRRAPSR